MLTEIIKEQAEQSATAYVSKLVDRIQIYKDSCGIDLLRYLIVNVDDSSSTSITGLNLILPNPKHIIDILENYTSKLLDRDYPFVKTAINYNVTDLSNRIISWDGVDNIKVLTNSQLELVALGETHTQLKVHFSETINPAQAGAVCFSYRISDFLVRMPPDKSLETSLVYFTRPHPLPIPLQFLNQFNLNVPCRVLYKHLAEAKEDIRVKGGFDIFVRYPVEYNIISNPPPTENEGISRYRLDGNRGDTERVINWKPRKLIAIDINSDHVDVRPLDIRLKVIEPVTRKETRKLFWFGLLGAFVISLLVYVIGEIITR